jgi:hypothetical protein
MRQGFHGSSLCSLTHHVCEIDTEETREAAFVSDVSPKIRHGLQSASAAFQGTGPLLLYQKVAGASVAYRERLPFRPCEKAVRLDNDLTVAAPLRALLAFAETSRRRSLYQSEYSCRRCVRQHWRYSRSSLSAILDSGSSSGHADTRCRSRRGQMDAASGTCPGVRIPAGFAKNSPAPHQ